MKVAHWRPTFRFAEGGAGYGRARPIERQGGVWSAGRGSEVGPHFLAQAGPSSDLPPAAGGRRRRIRTSLRTRIRHVDRRRWRRWRWWRRWRLGRRRKWRGWVRELHESRARVRRGRDGRRTARRRGGRGKRRRAQGRFGRTDAAAG